MPTFFEKVKKLLVGSDERRDISSNISWLLLEKGTRFLFGFIVSVWVVRYLGPKDYGIYSYAIAFTGIVGSFIGLGIEQIMVKELIKNPNNRNELLNNSFLIFLISALFMLVVSIVTIILLRGEDIETCILVLILSTGYLFRPFKVFNFYFESKILGKVIVPYILVGLVVTNLLKIYFVFYEGSLFAFAWILVFEEAFNALVLAYIYHSRVIPIKINWKINKILLKRILRDSLPLMLSFFMITIYMKIDQVMLREMVSDEELGLYSLAVVLTNIWFIIPIVITRSFFPKIVNSSIKEGGLINQQLQKLYNLMAFIGYGFCIPLTFLSEYLVVFIYGSEFAGAGVLLSTLIWTAFVMGFGMVRSTYIYAMNLTTQQLIITIIGAVGNICLNLILIPTYQGFGAVLATLISQLFACYASSFMFPSLRSNGIMMIKATFYPKIF